MNLYSVKITFSYRFFLEIVKKMKREVFARVCCSIITLLLVAILLYFISIRLGLIRREHFQREGFQKEHFQTATTPCVDVSMSPFPTGLIIVWNGSETSVPSGWALCNGQNGTPDLRGRFVLGHNPAVSTGVGISLTPNLIGSMGGEERVTLTKGQMPRHQHWYTEGGDYRVCSGCQEHEVGDNPWERLWWQATAEVGNNESHNNMPPYFALAYIMKL